MDTGTTIGGAAPDSTRTALIGTAGALAWRLLGFRLTYHAAGDSVTMARQGLDFTANYRPFNTDLAVSFVILRIPVMA